MLDEAYDELHNVFAMSLPLPKPPSATEIVDLHFMPIEDAIIHPFIDEHQSSLRNRRRVNNSVIGGVALGNHEARSAPKSDQNKFTQGSLELLHAMICMKPRCTYSATG